jgi:hypothetical protein
MNGWMADVGWLVYKLHYLLMHVAAIILHIHSISQTAMINY